MTFEIGLWYNITATQIKSAISKRKTLYFHRGNYTLFTFVSMNLAKMQIPLMNVGESSFVEICVATIGVCIFRVRSLIGAHLFIFHILED